MEKIWRFLKDEEGTETVEWAIIAAFLIATATAVWLALGNAVVAKINDLIGYLS